jgi:hypothetical protein
VGGISPEVRKIYKRRLRCLEEKRAYYGIDTPPHILMEIEDIERQLEYEVQKKVHSMWITR